MSTEAVKNHKIFFNLIFLCILTTVIATGVSADKGGGSCFLPGTLITMENGSQIPIENVKAGDKIASFDKDLNKVVTEVLETESPMRDDYYIISFSDGNELKITNEHPLYIKSANYEGWGSVIPEDTFDDAKIITRKIEVGNSVLNIKKKWIEITKIEHVNEKVRTYNLKKVDKTYTFLQKVFWPITKESHLLLHLHLHAL